MQDANTRTLDQGEDTADNATHDSNSTEETEIPNSFKRHLSYSGSISSVLCSDAERTTKIHSPQQPPPAAYCTGRVYNLDNNTAASPFPITKPLPSKDYQNRISTAIQNARVLPCAITAALLVPCVSTALTLLGGVAIRLSRIPGPRGVPIGKTFAVALAAGVVLGVLCGMAVLLVVWGARRRRRRTGGVGVQPNAAQEDNSNRGRGGMKAVCEDIRRISKSVVWASVALGIIALPVGMALRGPSGYGVLDGVVVVAEGIGLLRLGLYVYRLVSHLRMLYMRHKKSQRKGRLAY